MPAPSLLPLQSGVVNIGEVVYVKVVEIIEDDGSGRGPKIQCSIKVKWTFPSNRQQHSWLCCAGYAAGSCTGPDRCLITAVCLRGSSYSGTQCLQALCVSL